MSPVCSDVLASSGNKCSHLLINSKLLQYSCHRSINEITNSNCIKKFLSWPFVCWPTLDRQPLQMSSHNHAVRLWLVSRITQIPLHPDWLNFCACNSERMTKTCQYLWKNLSKLFSWLSKSNNNHNKNIYGSPLCLGLASSSQTESLAPKYGTHCQWISQFYLHTHVLIHEWYEPGILPS